MKSRQWESKLPECTALAENGVGVPLCMKGGALVKLSHCEHVFVSPVVVFFLMEDDLKPVLLCIHSTPVLLMGNN